MINEEMRSSIAPVDQELRLGVTLNSDPLACTSGSIWDYRPEFHHQGAKEMGSQIQGL